MGSHLDLLRFDRGIAAFWPRPTPKEAGRIACDRNEEKECAALAAIEPTEAFDGRFEGSSAVEFSRELRACSKTTIGRAMISIAALSPPAWRSMAKQWLFGGESVSTNAGLFPVEDYEGQIVTDLFGDKKYFADIAAFWDLQEKAIATRRDALLAKGWPEVIVLGRGEHFSQWAHDKVQKKDGGKVYVTVSHSRG